jgi:hypothetical protein
MKGLRRKVKIVLPALLVAAALPVAALPMSPATASPEAGEPFVAWLEGWLARLVPDWVAAATETPPPPEGIPFDDGEAIESCDPTMTICTGGDTLPDWDPDG